MKSYIEHHPWCVVETSFHAEFNEITESLMSLGNGRFGQRGNFEETFTGKTLPGNYFAGVWFPDKTRVGWWKNGYPNYFAKVINAINWVGFSIKIDGEEVDMAQNELVEFRRELNMQTGTLHRTCTIRLKSGKEVRLRTQRICNMAVDDTAQISYQIEPLTHDIHVEVSSFLDGTITNRDANHGDVFWEGIDQQATPEALQLVLKTKQSAWGNVPTFGICSAATLQVYLGHDLLEIPHTYEAKNKWVSQSFAVNIPAEKTLTIHKYVANISDLNHPRESLAEVALQLLAKSVETGFDQLQELHQTKWAEKWARNDIQIEGDMAAQQGIRFNIFHLQQTYTGEDARLNIGPKGFTGEKYGGVTYWDTEAYCIPFYLATAPGPVARNLLVYRHNHLPKAIDNATLLGFSGGAALYPMVTMNGEESHNEWEITFEEIHRNGAIAYAIYDYIHYTGDEKYLADYGLDVLVAISRFWAQRVNWSEDKNAFVMLGVTGPNEYENNVNNNWYTNYIARWTLQYTLESIRKVQEWGQWEAIAEKLRFADHEAQLWGRIIDNLYFPYDNKRQVVLQQDGFLDKELMPATAIQSQRPINQKWSWDRILRSCFIKQADVLQGFYFFEEDFSLDELKRNFDFYEPMTVHESSLSPCVHAILACKLGYQEKALEMYLRTSRLDLDDYNNDTEDGLHITSMAGTWMAVVKGFGGMRVRNNRLSLNPQLPDAWDSYSFRVGLNGITLEVSVARKGIRVNNLGQEEISFDLFGLPYTAGPNATVEASLGITF